MALEAVAEELELVKILAQVGGLLFLLFLIRILDAVIDVGNAIASAARNALGTVTVVKGECDQSQSSGTSKYRMQCEQWKQKRTFYCRKEYY